jgi:beta-glucanase (GH16 family)
MDKSDGIDPSFWLFHGESRGDGVSGSEVDVEERDGPGWHGYDIVYSGRCLDMNEEK